MKQLEEWDTNLKRLQNETKRFILDKTTNRIFIYYDIFWNYIDRYWSDSSLSTVDVFTKAYDSTAKTIMKRTTTSKDIIKIICIVVGILLIVGGIIYILRMKFKRDKEKAEETIEILKTPLDKTDELRDKYLNEEGKE